VPRAATDRIELKKQGYSRGMRAADGLVIEAGRETIDQAAPVLGLGNETVRMNGHTLKALVEAVTPEWGRIRNRVPEVGRYLVESDVETRATVALLGQKIKKDVFGSEEAIGREQAMLVSTVAAGLDDAFALAERSLERAAAHVPAAALADPLAARAHLEAGHLVRKSTVRSCWACSVA